MSEHSSGSLEDQPDVSILTSELSGSIFENIDSKIKLAAKDAETEDLWVEIRAAFDEGGPDAVKGVVEERVRASRLAVEKDLKQTRSVANSAVSKKKISVSKKVAAIKKVKTK